MDYNVQQREPKQRYFRCTTKLAFEGNLVSSKTFLQEWGFQPDMGKFSLIYSVTARIN